MSEFNAPQELPASDQRGPNLLAVYRAFAGSVIIAIGVVLGLYVAFSAFSLIGGKEPPGIAARIAKSVRVEVAENVRANGARPVELSPALKQMIVYGLAFFLLILPTVIAKVFLSSGAQLMGSDSVEAIKKLAEQLKRAARGSAERPAARHPSESLTANATHLHDRGVVRAIRRRVLSW